MPLVFGQAVLDLGVVAHEVVGPGPPLGARGKVPGLLDVGDAVKGIHGLPEPVGSLQAKLRGQVVGHLVSIELRFCGGGGAHRHRVPEKHDPLHTLDVLVVGALAVAAHGGLEEGVVGACSGSVACDLRKAGVQQRLLRIAGVLRACGVEGVEVVRLEFCCAGGLGYGGRLGGGVRCFRFHRSGIGGAASKAADQYQGGFHGCVPQGIHNVYSGKPGVEGEFQ